MVSLSKVFVYPGSKKLKMKKNLLNFGRGLVGWIFLLLRLLSLGNISPILVSSVLLVRGNKFLGINRTDGLGISLPGGIVKWSENSVTAAKRETFEETHLKIKLTRLLGVFDSHEGGVGLNSTHVVYLGKIISGKTRVSFEGEPKWYPIDTFSKDNLCLGKIIKSYLHQKQRKTYES